MSGSEIILSLRDVTKTFGVPGTSNQRTVLTGFSLTLSRGESLAITGPSGSGKTTLLNIIAALDKPDSGTVEYLGRDLAGLTGADLDSYRNRSIGMVFQMHHLLPQCTLFENILVPTLAAPDKSKVRHYRQRAEDLMQRMGLWEMRNQFPGQLSGGECQRTAVARALINDPDLLLADEPTGALDHANALNLVELLTEINRTDGKSVIMVTHSPELARMMGRVTELGK